MPCNLSSPKQDSGTGQQQPTYPQDGEVLFYGIFFLSMYLFKVNSLVSDHYFVLADIQSLGVELGKGKVVVEHL